MLEGMSQRMGEVGKRISQADAETLWAEIQQMASGVPWKTDDLYAPTNGLLASTIIRIAVIEHWTFLHTALALAYAHMVLASDHQKDITELLALSTRPMVIHPHCAGCTCKDTITRWENA